MTTTTLPPSTDQQTIYDWIHDGDGSASVIAVAGSGKTTTLVTGLRHRPNLAQRVKLFAFNTKIADELKERTKGMPGVSATTFHAQGYGALCRKLGIQKLPVMKGSSKLRGILADWLPRRDLVRYADWLCELVSLAKGDALGAITPATSAAWEALIDHHELTIDGVAGYEYDEALARGILLATQLLQKSTAAAEHEYAIDFDDMLYLPLLWRLDLSPVPWVLLDEAQDTNPARRAFVARSLQAGGRLIAVGDPHQAIYGFTGATVNAMDLIKAAFKTVDLPLSVCYRCARAIVAEAQAIVPHMQPWDEAPEGRVDTLPVREALKLLQPADAILCRNTAPLLKAAYWLLGQGVGCRVLGKDIGVGLLKLVDRMRASTVGELIDDLQTYATEQGAKLRAKGEDGQAAAIDDRVSSIGVIAQRLRPSAPVEELRAQLTTLFGLDDEGPAPRVLTLSTIHKAKGLEWPTVAILQPELMPSFWATADWERQQETNLKYVAITRARERLIWMDGKLEDE